MLTGSIKVCKVGLASGKETTFWGLVKCGYLGGLTFYQTCVVDASYSNVHLFDAILV